MTLGDFLASFAGAELALHEVTQDDVLQWRAGERAANCDANALRYLQGRALAYQLEQVPHGDRGAWKIQAGEVLGLSKRSVELLVQVGAALDGLLSNERSRNALRKEILDRPWRDVLPAVKAALRDEEDPEPESTEDDDGPTWKDMRWTVWREQRSGQLDDVWEDRAGLSKLRQEYLAEVAEMDAQLDALDEDADDESTLDLPAREAPERPITAEREPVRPEREAPDREEGPRRGRRRR